MASSGSEYDLAVAAESLELSSDSSGPCPQELLRVKLSAPINLPAVPEHVGGAGTPGRSPGPAPGTAIGLVARSPSDPPKMASKVPSTSTPQYTPTLRKRPYSAGRDPYVQSSTNKDGFSEVQQSRSRPPFGPSSAARDAALRQMILATAMVTTGVRV